MKNFRETIHILVTLRVPCLKLFIKELLHSSFSGILPTFYAISQISINCKNFRTAVSRTFVSGYFCQWKFDSDFHCTSWFWWMHFTHGHVKHFTHGQVWYLEIEILWKPLWWPSPATAIFACYNNELFWKFWENLVFLKKVNFWKKEACSSSNINEVIRSVLNFLFFLQKDFTSTKKHKTAYSKQK